MYEKLSRTNSMSVMPEDIDSVEVPTADGGNCVLPIVLPHVIFAALHAHQRLDDLGTDLDTASFWEHHKRQGLANKH
jgi:hypothetical protein